MTNLITAQQSSRQELTAMLRSMTPIEVGFDDGSDEFTTQFGKVEGHPIARSHSTGASRPCCHALETPLSQELFSREWVARMSWYPTLYRLGAGTPVIASRHFDLVTIAFDVIGPISTCSHVPGRLEDRNRFSYRLFPMRFWDDPEGAVFDRCWLGVWPD